MKSIIEKIKGWFVKEVRQEVGKVLSSIFIMVAEDVKKSTPEFTREMNTVREGFDDYLQLGQLDFDTLDKEEPKMYIKEVVRTKRTLSKSFRQIQKSFFNSYEKYEKKNKR